jgi:2-polyprenyl-3-methyl-5-hydroxy-6-metoxy-1,4-benzoquinol methylase
MLRFVKPDATDENWEYFGKKCPYFGVVSWQDFRPENFDAEARRKFFETGAQYIQWLFEIIRQKVRSDFKPVRALDFGCGVGRLLIPLARSCGKVTGIDVSASMRNEAAKNCLLAGIENFSLAASVDELLSQGAKFDFINSFIVFQHIRPKRGYLILDK